jgi:hypothetical protein
VESFILKLHVSSEFTSEEWNPDASDYLDSEPELEQREMAENEAKAYRALIGRPMTPK